jgi:hypothetical protein
LIPCINMHRSSTVSASTEDIAWTPMTRRWNVSVIVLMVTYMKG